MVIYFILLVNLFFLHLLFFTKFQKTFENSTELKSAVDLMQKAYILLNLYLRQMMTRYPFETTLLSTSFGRVDTVFTV